MTTRKRDVRKQFRLTEQEAAAFERAVRRSGLTQAEYLRQLIGGCIPQDALNQDYYQMMAELRKLRQDVNRYSDTANEYGTIPVGLYDDLADAVRDSIVAITKAVLEPRKVQR